MSKPIFYSGTRNASSWAMRAWLALRAAGVDFEENVVDIRRPQRFANLARIAEFSPSATVPALVVGDHVIFDSLAIMEWANDMTDGALLPRDISDRATARSLIAWQHCGLSKICTRISFESGFYPDRRKLTVEEETEVGRLCRAVAPSLADSGGAFLFGAAGLADFSLAPTVIRLGRHNPDLSKWPQVAAWFKAVLDHEFVREWLTEADQLPPIWFDSYLVQGWDGALTEATAP